MKKVSADMNSENSKLMSGVITLAKIFLGITIAIPIVMLIVYVIMNILK